jgi:hypothetical protein
MTRRKRRRRNKKTMRLKHLYCYNQFNNLNCLIFSFVSFFIYFLFIYLFIYKSSSSSGNGALFAASISNSYFLTNSGSICTSGGSNAGMATNSKLGSPANLRANHRKGFSKL